VVSKKTLPQGAASGALYVLAVAAGVLLSKPVAAVLAILATLVLLLTVAGTRAVQRHLPDLGRLPLVEDHGFRAHLNVASRSMPAETKQRPSTETIKPAGESDANLRALLTHGRSVSDRHLAGTMSPLMETAARKELLLWTRDVIGVLRQGDLATADRFEAASSHQERMAILADYLGIEEG
jgi:hypothetical protein